MERCLEGGRTVSIKVVSFSELAQWRDGVLGPLDPNRIVAASGCFDVISAGHILYLKKAKSLGDILIVGVNSDASIRRLKGKDRPINKLENRLVVLCELECVDFVTVFNHNHAGEFLMKVKANTWVKGVGYTKENLPFMELAIADYVGTKIVIDGEKYSKSTTEVLNAIKD